MPPTTRNRTRAAKKIFKFFALPLEVREMIYELVINPSINIKVKSERTGRKRRTRGLFGLMRANKQVYAELKDVMFRTATFELEPFMLERNHSRLAFRSEMIPLSGALKEMRSIEIPKPVDSLDDFYDIRPNLRRFPNLRRLVMTLRVPIQRVLSLGVPGKTVVPKFRVEEYDNVYARPGELAVVLAEKWATMQCLGAWSRNRLEAVTVAAEDNSYEDQDELFFEIDMELRRI